VAKAALRSSAAGTTSPQACFTTGRGNVTGAQVQQQARKGALKDRIEKLERLVGKLTLENEFLKKGLQHSLSQSQRNGKSSPLSNTSSGISAGGVD